MRVIAGLCITLSLSLLGAAFVLPVNLGPYCIWGSLTLFGCVLGLNYAVGGSF